MPSITSGVASNDDREGISLPSLQSSVSKVQAISSVATLARLIWAREECLGPPGVPADVRPILSKHRNAGK
jgi:hypothetical protein